MVIRQAVPRDLDTVMERIKEAKSHLKRQEIDQWQGTYPGRADILADLDGGAGYVLADGAEIAGYACISFAGDPNYSRIDGAWLSGGPSAVIHRLTIGDDWRGRGLAGHFFQYAERLCAERGVRSVKVDTGRGNRAMQRLVMKHGFALCGVVQVDGADRLAYEKVL